MLATYIQHIVCAQPRRIHSPLQEAIVFGAALDEALRTHDLGAGPRLLDSLEASTTFTLDKRRCSQLLYLCSGGDEWESLLWKRHGSPPDAPLPRALMLGKQLDAYRPRSRGAAQRRTPGYNPDLGAKPEELAARFEREMAD